ncbi:MAG: hypothetical protein ACPGTP_00175 [Bacteroidia bacterium]
MILVLVSFFRYLLPKHIAAITIWPFMLFKRKEDTRNVKILNHEKIHLRQQLELLVIPFYIIYLIEYVVLLIVYRDHDKAYRNISFEKEAYTNDSNITYLKTRPIWAMWRSEKS